LNTHTPIPVLGHPPKNRRKCCSKSSIPQSRIGRFRSYLVHSLITWHAIYYTCSMWKGQRSRLLCDITGTKILLNYRLSITQPRIVRFRSTFRIDFDHVTPDLFHDLLSAPMFHHSVWSVITAHKLTPVKRDVNTVVSDQQSRFTAPSIGDYNTPDTVAKHRRQM